MFLKLAWGQGNSKWDPHIKRRTTSSGLFGLSALSIALSHEDTLLWSSKNCASAIRHSTCAYCSVFARAQLSQVAIPALHLSPLRWGWRIYINEGSPQCTAACKDSYHTPAQICAHLFQEEMLRRRITSLKRCFSLLCVGIPHGRLHSNAEECSWKRTQTHEAELKELNQDKSTGNWQDSSWIHKAKNGVQREVTNLFWCSTHQELENGAMSYRPAKIGYLWVSEKKKNASSSWGKGTRHVLPLGTCWLVRF